MLQHTTQAAIIKKCFPVKLKGGEEGSQILKEEPKQLNPHYKKYKKNSINKIQHSNARISNDNTLQIKALPPRNILFICLYALPLVTVTGLPYKLVIGSKPAWLQ